MRWKWFLLGEHGRHFLNVSVMGFFLKVMPLRCTEFSIDQTLDVENVHGDFKFSGALICSCKQKQAGGLQIIK